MCSRGCGHPEWPGTWRPNRNLRKAKSTGLGVETDLTLLEGLSTSHLSHPQQPRGWQGAGPGSCVSHRSWTKNTAHLAVMHRIPSVSFT